MSVNEIGNLSLMLLMLLTAKHGEGGLASPVQSAASRPAWLAELANAMHSQVRVSLRKNRNLKINFQQFAALFARPSFC